MNDYKEIIRFQAERKLVVLHKFVLKELEQLTHEQKEQLSKIRESLIELGYEEDLEHLMPFFNFFSEEKYKLLRKKILDTSNDLIRELER